MSRLPIITLLSDFGLRDAYVAEMKAVILSICRNASIVDISHNIRKFDIRMGAFILAQAAPYFPNETIHMAVVDPDVGTKRRPIIIQGERSLYVGPDNGLLMLSAQREGIDHIYEVNNPRYMLKNISRTFHGRDIFSPVSAYLAKGVLPADFGPEIRDPVAPSFAKPKIWGGRIRAEAIHIDVFGNIITNITLRELEEIGVGKGGNLLVKLKGKNLAVSLCPAYGEVPRKMPLAIMGGSGFLEVSINQGDASKVFHVEAGDTVVVEKR